MLFAQLLLGLRLIETVSTSGSDNATVGAYPARGIKTGAFENADQDSNRRQLKMTSKQRARMILITATTAAVLLLAPVQPEARGPLYGTTYASKVTGKLWSGISNSLFSWVEIPIEINREIQNTDPFTGTFVGLGRGSWFTVRRLGLGLVDVVTFPVDVYDNNYQSIQRTEFPFIDEVE